MFIIVKLTWAGQKTKRLPKMIFFLKVPNSTTAHRTTASQKIWGYCKPINKDYRKSAHINRV